MRLFSAIDSFFFVSSSDSATKKCFLKRWPSTLTELDTPAFVRALAEIRSTTKNHSVNLITTTAVPHWRWPMSTVSFRVDPARPRWCGRTPVLLHHHHHLLHERSDQSTEQLGCSRVSRTGPAQRRPTSPAWIYDSSCLMLKFHIFCRLPCTKAAAASSNPSNTALSTALLLPGTWSCPNLLTPPLGEMARCSD